MGDRQLPNMRRALFLSLILGALAVSHGCTPPDCDRPDFGTCVNACCKVKFTIETWFVTAADVVKEIAAQIASGGPDGLYLPVENNTVQPYSSATDFVVQAIHQTAKHTYSDTLHFAVSPGTTNPPQFVTVHAFSHSQDFIQGNFAYGDHGQNYKNLKTLILGTGFDFSEKSLFGCPANSSSVSEAGKVEAVSEQPVASDTCCACVKGSDMGSDLWSFSKPDADCNTCCVKHSAYASGKAEGADVCSTHAAMKGSC